MEYDNIRSWQQLRITLAQSLKDNLDVNFFGAEDFFSDNPHWLPLFNDISNVLDRENFGQLQLKGDTISFSPKRITKFSLEIESQKYSSIVEILLLLMPYLFTREFRTKINFVGVTHNFHSYSTAFMKNAFFAILEKMGFFASLNLQSFAFYGNAKGHAEARIYPQEKKDFSMEKFFVQGKFMGVKIFISQLNTDIAKRQKEYICKNFSFDENKVSIFEISGKHGYGNVVEFYVQKNDVNFIFSTKLEIIDTIGNIFFDEKSVYSEIDKTFLEADDFLNKREMPAFLLSELILYTK